MQNGGSNFENTSNYKYHLYPDPPYPDFTQIGAVRISFIIVYVVVMILALTGNAMVCFTVFRNKKMHTAVNYYIVNLGVSDFMVGFLVLPVKLLEMTAPAEWGMLNDTLCTALLYIPTIVVFASVLTLVATCFERYFAVVHPLESRMLHSKSRVMYILFAVWAIPSLAAVPFLKPAKAITHELSSTFGTIRRQACMQSLDDNFRKYYYTFLFFAFYSFPLLIITGTCIRIACCLLTGIKLQREGTLRRQEINRRKIAKMVIVVAIAFAICWTPYFTISMVTQYHPVNYFEHQNYYFTMLCINLFAFTNSCVNPFIYASMSVRFRNGFKSILGPLCGNMIFENKQELLKNTNLRLNNPKINKYEQHGIRTRYLNTKSRPKRLVIREKVVSTPPTSPSANCSDIQLALLRLGSLRTFSEVNTHLLNGMKTCSFSSAVIPPSPTWETTRTSRLASISTSRRSSYNASKLALNAPTVEDILTCPTYKHWVREMKRTELVQRTVCSLPIAEPRERACSFSAPENNDLKIRNKSRVQFGNVIEHSHSAVELSSWKDHSDNSDKNAKANNQIKPHKQTASSKNRYCLDLAISFDRRLSNLSLSDPWNRKLSNASIMESDIKHLEDSFTLKPTTVMITTDGNVGKYSEVATEKISMSSKIGNTNVRTQENLCIPQPEGRRRQSLLSNKELSTCDEESEFLQVLQNLERVKRSTSDTALCLFPTANETIFRKP